MFPSSKVLRMLAIYRAMFTLQTAPEILSQPEFATTIISERKSNMHATTLSVSRLTMWRLANFSITQLHNECVRFPRKWRVVWVTRSVSDNLKRLYVYSHNMYLILLEQLSASMGWCDGAKQLSLDNLQAQVCWTNSIHPWWCFDFQSSSDSKALQAWVFFTH